MEEDVEKQCELIRDDFYRDGFGNTPMFTYKLSNGSAVFAKLEYFNPYGSIKDRGAFFMIDHLLHTEKNIEEKVFVEGTSGNTGIAIANICKRLGMKAMIFIPPGTSDGTKEVLKKSGARIVETDEPPETTKTEVAINTAMDLAAKEPGKYVFLHQHGNIFNYLAHVYTTGPEAEKQMGGLPDAVAIAMGTGGSIIGNARYFKNRNKNITVYMLHADQTSYIQGVRNFLKAKDKVIVEKNISLVDFMVNVNEGDARNGVQKLARECGVYVGFSSGANFMGALKVAESTSNIKVYTVFPDSGEKYTEFYNKAGILNEKETEALSQEVNELKSGFILLK
ncbi:MAG: PLP-dependent cysteine synthase family protein [Candidatus Thermoplasmatota archaeon]|nr:PLP-dependent cysteine synthase family protein [Candidatus Thermoplasmatota archaeon]